MPRLIETARALQSLGTAQELGFGMHMSGQIKTANQGSHVGEVLLDPSRHSASAINLASPMEMATGLPHVRQVIPNRPLSMNVIIHDDSANYSVPDWLSVMPAYKQQLAVGLRDTIKASKRAYDLADIYLIGNPRWPERYGSGTRFVGGAEDPVAAAKKIGELCAKTGITFLISDFYNLPLGKVGDKQSGYKRTVGLKVNHPLELNTPANVGNIPLGGTNEVDTTNRRKLKAHNEKLLRRHGQIVSRIGEAGVKLATTVTYANNGSKFDDFTTHTLVVLPNEAAVVAIDKPVASAVQDVRHRK